VSGGPRGPFGFFGIYGEHENLAPKTWEEVKAECKRQSDDHFLALPGMRALDKEGNTWFALGYTSFPNPVSYPDLKRLDNTYHFWAADFGGGLVGFAKVMAIRTPGSK